MQKNSRHYLRVERSIDTGKTIIQKVTVKTRPANWQGTDQPVILPFISTRPFMKELREILRWLRFCKLLNPM